MPETFEGGFQAKGKKFAIVVSRSSDFITEKLLAGAFDAFSRCGVSECDIDIIKTPGAFEIPLTAKKVADKNLHHAVVCLGAVIRGSTPHFDCIAAVVTKGIGAVTLESGIPIIFGVLTTDTIEQAIERAGTKSGNKGWAAAMAAIEMANLVDAVS